MGEIIRNGIPLRKHSQEAGEGRAVFQVKGLETGEEQLKLKRFTSRVRKGGNRDI